MLCDQIPLMLLGQIFEHASHEEILSYLVSLLFAEPFLLAKLKKKFYLFHLKIFH